MIVVILIILLVFFVCIIVVPSHVTVCPNCRSIYLKRPKECKTCYNLFPVKSDRLKKRKVLGLFERSDHYEKEFIKKFLLRWIIFFAIGCLIVTIYFKGDTVALVRAPSAVMNKYGYVAVASAIVALLSLRQRL